jgi:hypothetical protein
MNEAIAQPAAVSGQASVIRKADVQHAINAQPAVLHMTIEIKRAATGQTEVYELVGTPVTQES